MPTIWWYDGLMVKRFSDDTDMPGTQRCALINLLKPKAGRKFFLFGCRSPPVRTPVSRHLSAHAFGRQRCIYKSCGRQAAQAVAAKWFQHGRLRLNPRSGALLFMVFLEVYIAESVYRYVIRLLGHIRHQFNFKKYKIIHLWHIHDTSFPNFLSGTFVSL